VTIPPGVDTGSEVRVKGEGHAGSVGAPSGDLVLITRVQPHPFFARKGDNLHCEIPVTVTEAALGAKIEVPTIDGRAVVVPFLRHAGVAHLDMLIVSHGDNDHIGGSASLLAAVPVTRVLSSVPERLANAEDCHHGQAWEWDGVRLAIVHPQSDGRLAGNNRSCVLRVEGRFGAVLLPGDIAAKAERDLLSRAGEPLRADILVVPHHGSKTSSTEAFLDTVRPQVALLPVGYRNRYRHPHPTVVARYRERGIVLEDSASAGAIRVELGNRGLRLNRYRETHRRYWQGE